MSQRSPSTSRRGRRARCLARGLGWFGIGLGTAQLLMPDRLARAAGLRVPGCFVRACGLREIGSGLAILRSDDPVPWLWLRAGGDLLDIAGLGLAAGGRHGGRTGLAIAATAAVAAADFACAQTLSSGKLRRQAGRRRDYRDRSGLPLPPDEMRGAALADFRLPPGMGAPAALRPYEETRNVSTQQL